MHNFDVHWRYQQGDIDKVRMLLGARKQVIKKRIKGYLVEGVSHPNLRKFNYFFPGKNSLVSTPGA